MATGPAHYQEAELLLLSCQSPVPRVPGDAETYPEREDGVDSTGHALAAAQVHATLALAAATAMAGAGMGIADYAAWNEMLGVSYRPPRSAAGR